MSSETGIMPSEATVDTDSLAGDSKTATNAGKANDGRLSANDWCEFEEIDKPVYMAQVPKTTDRFDCECSFDPENDLPSAACGEDCLNRQLMIECDPKRCRVGVRCQNRRIQNGDKCAVEVFKTELKGWGLRAKEDIQRGDFIYEYVGEVYTQAQFEQRQVQYHEEGRYHYYFMSLDADHVIDATLKGGLSRFINHSCDPNAETQKWTVNGYLRIGFFAIQDIPAGEEITFDYQYERYGEQAQACYCGASNCRGTLGKKREASSRSSRTDRDREKARLNDFLNTITTSSGGLKNSTAVVKLLQRMVQSKSAFDIDKRDRMLAILTETSDDDILTTFIAKRGLFVFRLWLQDMVPEQQLDLIRKVVRICLKLPLKTRNPVVSASLPAAFDQVRGLNDAVSNELIDEFDKRDLETVYVIPEREAQPVDKVFVPRSLLRNYNQQVIRWVEDSSRARVELMRLLPGDAELEIRIKGSADSIATAKQLIEGIRDSWVQRTEEQERLARVKKEEAKLREQMEQEQKEMDQQAAASQAEQVPERVPSKEPVMFVEATDALSSEPLHPNWESTFDANEREYYYYDIFTSETSWQRPIIQPLSARVQQRTAKRNLPGLAGLDEMVSIDDAIKQRKSEKPAKKRPKTAEEAQASAVRKFKEQVSPYVIKYLKPHRDKKVKYGHIRNDKDFKYLARKLTHQIVDKQQKRVGDAHALKMTDSLKEKIKTFVKETMKKCGKVFQPPRA
eukprot:TRINITY_DN5496_c0_g1_i2.p1 TRINITY_DN5496_c0_g1~~TRINITY_DN5496_c0_g1_i2.p1  ORF type:complete len:735 (+),score=235.57 TRINITY_DN5496_c0_g1_i2:150-2354(+)